MILRFDDCSADNDNIDDDHTNDDCGRNHCRRRVDDEDAILSAADSVAATTMMQLHSSMSLPRQQQITATTSQSTTKLQVYVGGMIVCPNLGIHFPRGDNHKGRIITQEKAASLPFFRRNQVPSLLYDANMNGFHPKNWRFHVSREKINVYFYYHLMKMVITTRTWCMCIDQEIKMKTYFFIVQHLSLLMNAMQSGEQMVGKAKGKWLK